MKRFPAYDPPEYQNWQPDPETMAGFRARIDADPARRDVVRAIAEDDLLAFYGGLLRNRLH
ncbi:MAG: hypothetical protein ICV87_01010 [Gemmatimonadetes bacterium]|nr:hypothetical protein [Gemmatimonadota bacterium]